MCFSYHTAPQNLDTKKAVLDGLDCGYLNPKWRWVSIPQTEIPLFSGLFFVKPKAIQPIALFV
ncbi:hypothetical protein, partial [Glaesserella parasuis]|uniref:hypothetical protein n=1 Tax=Glaesserella parasuis TaxID=738 RepID=UPI0024367F3D